MFYNKDFPSVENLRGKEEKSIFMFCMEFKIKMLMKIIDFFSRA
jgi:hypothetical protein